MAFYQKSVSETLKLLGASKNGLSSSEAAERLQSDGLNQIQIKKEPLWRKILAPFASVMIGVLFAAGLMSLWRKEFIDAVIVFLVIIISAAIDWTQKWSTERILRSLRKIENEDIEVYRDGKVSNLRSDNVVRGDIIILHEGQKVPADARVIESDNLHIDESMLTGESLSVKKISKEITGNKEVYEQSNMLFSGSFVVTGAGIAIVTDTGNNTEFGKMAKLAGSADLNSPLQKKIDNLIRLIVVIVFCLAILTFLLQILRGAELAEALRFVLAFAVSAVPEGLPIAITVVLALGMQRMAAEKALVRNMRAIENIGLVTTIATDKTGTLTRNELRVQDIWAPTLRPATFALHSSFALNVARGYVGDPLDTAMSIYIKHYKVKLPHQQPEIELIESFPFDYRWTMSGNIWRFGKKYELYLKGAPEKIIAKCRLSSSDRAKATDALYNFTHQGFRVIAFAKITLRDPIKTLSKIPNHGMELIGLVAIADELRPGVTKSIREAMDAGVRVRMITGDHAETAYSIAEKIGIASNTEQVYDSRYLGKLSPPQLSEVVEGTFVYSRVVPESKYLILSELNKTDITAMTGDGVNDVPALSKAHIGIAMGSGAAIAKDASDVVLLDNNFRSIVTAIREGRIIIANIRRMLVYLIATNAGEVLTMIGALLIGLPLPVLAVQILWINLITDTFMVIPLGLEAGDRNIMRQPPAKTDAPILSKFMIGRVVITAFVMASVTLATFAIFLEIHGEAEARSAAFLVLIVIQWTNAVIMRSELPINRILKLKNKVFSVALFSAILLQAVVILTPLRSILHLEILHIDSLLACVGAIFVMVFVLELHKWLGRQRGGYQI